MFRTCSAILLFCVAVSTSAQTLTCPSSVAAGCGVFHYHLQAWSPNTKSVAEITGANSFSTEVACEESRKQRESANTDAIKYLAVVAHRMKTQPNRYGACHCDMTREQTHPNYLDDSRRLLHVRMDQQFRNEMLSELFERELATDSDLALAFSNFPSKFHGTALWKPLTIPPEGETRLLRPEATALLNTSVSPAVNEGDWQKELRLVEISIDRDAAGPGVAGGGFRKQNQFVSVESAKIQAIILDASRNEGNDRASVLRACSERMKLLSKLDRLMQLDVRDSKLVRAADNAAADASRTHAFVSQLFGFQVADHWDPGNPAGMSFVVPPEIASDPVAVLRDATGRFGVEQQKLALYTYLLTSPLIESDEPWLRAVAESWFGGQRP